MNKCLIACCLILWKPNWQKYSTISQYTILKSSFLLKQFYFILQCCQAFSPCTFNAVMSLYSVTMVKGINQSLNASFTDRIKNESKDAGYIEERRSLQTKRRFGLMFLSLNLNGLFYHMQFPGLYEPLNAISICSKSSKIEIFTRNLFRENTRVS